MGQVSISDRKVGSKLVVLLLLVGLIVLYGAERLALTHSASCRLSTGAQLARCINELRSKDD